MASPVTGTQPGVRAGGEPSTPAALPARIVIQYPAPAVDGGRYAAKRCVGDHVEVQADIFRDGHELIRAVVRYREPGERKWREAAMRHLDAHLEGVRWSGGFEVGRLGRYQYTVQAWTDVFGTWRDELARKLAGGQKELMGELSEGILLLQRAAERASGEAERQVIEHAVATLRDPAVPEAAKHDVALGPELHETVERTQERHGCVSLEQPLQVEVDRLRAR